MTNPIRQLPPLCLRIGCVDAVLRTNVRRLRRDYAALYAPFVTDHPAREAVELTVTAHAKRWRVGRQYEIHVDGRHRFSPTRYEEVLPYVEWALNWELPRRRPEAMWLHAASLERDGVGVILPGGSGSGKSTLALALIARGWRYLCDEFAIVDARTATLRSFPRAICVKESGYGVLDRLGYERPRQAAYIKGFKGRVTFIQPMQRFSTALGRDCPVQSIIFPKYKQGATTTLTPIPRSQAILDLHRAAFNLFGCQRPALDVFLDLARGAECHRLTSGDIGAACDCVERIVTAKDAFARTA